MKHRESDTPGEPEPVTMPEPERVAGAAAVLPRLVAVLSPERARLTLVGALAVISVALLVTGPWILGRATDVLFAGVIGDRVPEYLSKTEAVAAVRAMGQNQLADMLAAMTFQPGVGVDLDRLGRMLALAAVVYLLSFGFAWGQGHLLAGITQRTMYGLRQAVEEKLGRLPLRYFDRHPHGDILSRVTNDIDNLNTTLQEVLTQLPTAVLTVLGILGIMFWVSPLLAAVSLLTIPLVVLVTALIATRSKGHFSTQWEQTGQLTGLVEEGYAGHEVLLAYGQQDAMGEEFGRRNGRLKNASFRAQFLSGAIFPAVLFVGNLNHVVIAAVGGYQVATGVISIGAVQAFIQYAKRFTSPITQIASQMNLIQSGLASAERVFEFLDATEDKVLDAAPTVSTVSGQPAQGARKVQLQEVSFRYDPETPLIEDFSLEAAPGQTVAIVGATGAGKTTIVNLLIRFYEIDSGRILLDGVDYRELSRDEVRQCFGMVLQDAWLFRGTIRDNIGYGKEDATDDEIIAAAKAAHVDDFVRTLPDGYQTLLDGDATNISTGQKQLLTIARAFLADPGILILDEATSSVDSRTEVMIQTAMARLQSGRTTFVIAHRLSTIRDADTIVVMEAGRVIEQGGHEELLSRRGAYFDLYNSQFSTTSPS